MKVVCRNCQKSYNLDDNKIPLEGINVKCPRCLKTFRITHPTTRTDVEKTAWLPSMTSTGDIAASPAAKIEQPTMHETNAGKNEFDDEKFEVDDPWGDENRPFLEDDEPSPSHPEEPEFDDEKARLPAPLPETIIEDSAEGEPSAVIEDKGNEFDDLDGDNFSFEETHVIIANPLKKQKVTDPLDVYKRNQQAEQTKPPENEHDNRGFDDYAGKTSVSSLTDDEFNLNKDPIAQDNDFDVVDAGSRTVNRPSPGLIKSANRDPGTFPYKTGHSESSLEPPPFDRPLTPPNPFLNAPPSQQQRSPSVSLEEKETERKSYDDIIKEEIDRQRPVPAAQTFKQERQSGVATPDILDQELPYARDIRRQLKTGKKSTITGKLAKLSAGFILVYIAINIYDYRQELISSYRKLTGLDKQVTDIKGDESSKIVLSEDFIEGRNLFLYDTPIAYKKADYLFLKAMVNNKENATLKCADAENKLVWGYNTKDKTMLEAAKKIIDQVLVDQKTAACYRSEIYYYLSKESPTYLASAADLNDRYFKLNRTDLADFHHLAGLIAKKEGNVQKARRNFYRALDEDPLFLKSLREIYAIAKDSDKAESSAIADKITKIEKTYIKKYPELANERSVLATDETEKEPASILTQPPPEPKEKVVSTDRRSRRHALVKKSSTSPIKSKPANTAGQENFNAGNLLFKQKKFTNAKLEFEKAVSGNPQNPHYHYKLGETLDLLYQSDAAIYEMDKAIKINPNFADAYKTRGFIYGKLGEKSKAIEDLRKYTELKPQASDSLIVNNYIEELSQ